MKTTNYRHTSIYPCSIEDALDAMRGHKEFQKFKIINRTNYTGNPNDVLAIVGRTGQILIYCENVSKNYPLGCV